MTPRNNITKKSQSSDADCNPELGEPKVTKYKNYAKFFSEMKTNYWGPNNPDGNMQAGETPLHPHPNNF